MSLDFSLEARILSWIDKKALSLIDCILLDFAQLHSNEHGLYRQEKSTFKKLRNIAGLMSTFLGGCHKKCIYHLLTAYDNAMRSSFKAQVVAYRGVSNILISIAGYLKSSSNFAGAFISESMVPAIGVVVLFCPICGTCDNCLTCEKCSIKAGCSHQAGCGECQGCLESEGGSVCLGCAFCHRCEECQPRFECDKCGCFPPADWVVLREGAEEDGEAEETKQEGEQ